MVIRESKKSVVYFIPECTCNKKVKRVIWKTRRQEFDPEMEQWAKDHEELHTLSSEIFNFITTSGSTEREDILKNFSDYKETQLQMAANLGMYPIIFPKRRHAPPAEFHRLRQHAYTITDEYRKAKYAEEPEEEPLLVEE